MPSPDATPHWVNPSPGASPARISNADFATPNFNLNPPCPQPPDTGPGISGNHHLGAVEVTIASTGHFG